MELLDTKQMKQPKLFNKFKKILERFEDFEEFKEIEIQIVLICLVGLNFFIPTVKSGLGSIQPKKVVTIISGEETSFNILLFTLDQETHVKINIEEKPDPLNVKIEPKNLKLTPNIVRRPSDSSEYIKLKGIDGYVKAEEIEMKLKAHWTLSSKEYPLKISAVTLNEENGTLTAVQSREFTFTVKVKGFSLPKWISFGSSGIPDTSESLKNAGKITGRAFSGLGEGFSNLKKGLHLFMFTPYLMVILVWIIFALIAVPLWRIGNE